MGHRNTAQPGNGTLTPYLKVRASFDYHKTPRRRVKEKRNNYCICSVQSGISGIGGGSICGALRRMAKELAKKASELVSAISSVSTGGFSTRPSRTAYDEVPGQSQDQTVHAHEVLAERASRAAKLVGGISSGGLSTRPSRKAYEAVKSPFEESEPKKPCVSPLKTLGEDAEVRPYADAC